MVDIKYLAKCGVSSAAYKKIFTKPREKMTQRQRALINLLSARNRDGFIDSLTDYRSYQAIDLAHEVSFDQTTPTLVNNIMCRGLDEKGTREALAGYGLSEDTMFTKIPAPGRIGEYIYELNPPVFFQIYIPIVKAYLQAVLAQIFNERNTIPLFPYKPIKNTVQNQVICEIITDREEERATWYGYATVLMDAIQQMLKYGVVLSFPREEWHCEKQVVDWTGKPETIVVKEGIRYILPHPTRMFYDFQYPATTFNTDTGCSYAGHWTILKYGEVLDNPLYWNRNAIFGGTNWFQAPGVNNYFNEVFPCQLKFLGKATWGDGVGQLREDRSSYYKTTDDRDKAVFVTEQFVKIIPDNWDLTDRSVKGQGYKYPVWHRFTMAGDDTVVWAQPCAYNPIWMMGYDYDQLAFHNPSFALELIPWQDHLGMLLTQMLLTAKQNLADVTFYNEMVVDKEDITQLKNLGERRYRARQFIGFNALKMNAAKVDMDHVFSNVDFQKMPIAELQQCIPTCLTIMERVLGISAQTTGGAASHQQSKAEVIQTNVSSTNRIQKISTSVDQAEDAWMRQLYEADQAYGDASVTAEVSADIPDVKKHLEKMNYTITSEDDDALFVVGKKENLRLEGFASRNMGPRHENDKETAAIISQTVSTVAGQPDLHKAIGAKNLLRLLEWAARLAGAPMDFHLRINKDADKDQEVPENIQKAIQQAAQVVMQAVEEKIAKPVAQEVAQDKAQIEQIQAVLKKLEGIYKVAEASQQKVNVERQRTEAKIALDQKKQQADQALQEHKAIQEEARKDRALIRQLQRDNALLQQRLKAAQEEAAAKIDNQKMESEARAKAAAKQKPKAKE